MGGTVYRFTSGIIAASLLASPAAAAPAHVDPFVALSVFGTSESRAAVCSAGSQAAAQAGAAAAQVAGSGPECVLPVVDAAPPSVEPAPAPLPVAPVATGSSVGVLPLLLGLAAIAAVAAVVLHDNDDDGEINLPISP